MMETLAALKQDPRFWVLLSTLAFVVLAWVKGRGPIVGILDGRTARIKGELDEAERLRNEAQHLLSETQRKHREALHTAQKIIDNAKETAERIAADAAQKLDDQQKRREAQLVERISRAEAAAVAELKRQAADLAARASEQLLRDALSKNGQALINEAIEEIPSKVA